MITVTVFNVTINQMHCTDMHVDRANIPIARAQGVKKNHFSMPRNSRTVQGTLKSFDQAITSYTKRRVSDMFGDVSACY